MKHTKGPWEIGSGMYNADTNDYDVVVTSEARDICTVETFFGDAQANACLIASAPNMLDALEMVSEALELVGLGGNDHAYHRRVEKAVNEAIQKAKEE